MVSTGIQQLVSTYEFHGREYSPDQLKVPRSGQNFLWGGGGTLLTNSNSKCQDLAKFSFSRGGGGGRRYSPDQLKLKVSRSPQILIGGGGVTLLTNSNSKCQDLSTYKFHGRGYSPDQLKVPRSGQIFWGVTLLTNSISKCQDLVKF